MSHNSKNGTIQARNLQICVANFLHFGVFLFSVDTSADVLIELVSSVLLTMRDCLSTKDGTRRNRDENRADLKIFTTWGVNEVVEVTKENVFDRD